MTNLLTNEELAALAGKGEKWAKDELLIRNDRLNYHIAQKFTNTKIPKDDLASISRVGMIKAIKWFDPEKKVKFATFASRCMTNEILMFLRKHKKTRKETSLEQPLNTDIEGNTMTLADTLIDPSSSYIEEMFELDGVQQAIDTFLNQASLRDKEIFNLFYSKGMSQHDIARKYDLSQSYISRLLRSYIKTIQKLLNQMPKDNNKKGENKLTWGKKKFEEADFVYVVENYPEIRKSELASKFGCSTQTIVNYMKKYSNDQLDRNNPDKEKMQELFGPLPEVDYDTPIVEPRTTTVAIPSNPERNNYSYIEEKKPMSVKENTQEKSVTKSINAKGVDLKFNVNEGDKETIVNILNLAIGALNESKEYTLYLSLNQEQPAE